MYPTIPISDSFVAKIKQRATTVSKIPVSANQGADLTAWCGAVFNQEQEGSCTACTTRDYLLWLQNKYGYNPVVDPAVNALYYFARTYFNDVNQDAGASLATAFLGAMENGVIPSNDEDYSKNTLFEVPPTQDVAFKAISNQTYAATTDSIRSILDTGIPAGVSVSVDQTLFNPADTPDGLTAVVDVYTAVPNEGHAVLVVGYRTHPTYKFLYRFQNSWGTSYGDHGFAWFTEAYLTKNLYEVAALDIPKSLTPPSPPVPVPTPPVPTPQPVKQYPSDIVNTQWQPVGEWVLDNKVMFAYQNGLFQPDQPISRGQFAASLMNLYNLIKK